MIYLVGSLRNPRVPEIANVLRASGYEVFDDWYAAGPEADDKWQAYEQGRGHSYVEGLAGLAADHVYQFDLRHLDRADAAVLVLPAGKSGHLELGHVHGRGKPVYILLDGEPKRWDVMYRFATVAFDLPDLIGKLKHADLSSLKLREPGPDQDGTQRPSSPRPYDHFELVSGEGRPVFRAETREWRTLRNPGLGRDSHLGPAHH